MQVQRDGALSFQYKDGALLCNIKTVLYSITDGAFITSITDGVYSHIKWIMFNFFKLKLVNLSCTCRLPGIIFQNWVILLGQNFGFIPTSLHGGQCSYLLESQIVIAKDTAKV